MESMKVGAGLLADKAQDGAGTAGAGKAVSSTATANIINNNNNNTRGPFLQQSLVNNFGLSGKDEQLQDGKPFQQHEFNLDRSEYQQVFKVFDKEGTGEITIHQVYDLINKFDQASLQVQGGSNLCMYSTQQQQQQTNGPSGSHSQSTGGYHKSGRHNQLGTKSYAQGTASSQLYQNGQQVVGGKKQGAGSSGVAGGGIGGPGGSSGYRMGGAAGMSNAGGQGNEASKMSSPNRIIGNNNHLHNATAAQQQSTSISNGGINGSMNPRLSKSKQISPTLPGGNNYYHNNKEKSPRRQSQYNNSSYHHQHHQQDGADHDDVSPGLGQKNSKIKSGAAQAYNQGGVGANSNSLQNTSSSTPTAMEFPNGKESLQFEEFIDVIRESCSDQVMAENYLVLAFSMFDRQKKGYISKDDLKHVFELLGESITDEEVNTMIKIAGIKSNDKINFKEFVDFFYKID